MKKPVYTVETTPPFCTTGVTLLVACKLAQRFQRHEPTIAQLREEFGMSRATAYRWRSAFRTAKGQA